MVKRVVDTKFWSSMDVLDNYSVDNIDLSIQENMEYKNRTYINRSYL